MNGKKLWIQIWTEKIKQSKKNNNTKALAFLESWKLQDPINVLRELIVGTNAYQAGKWGSAYVVQIPNGDKEAIRNRWANHPSKETEWPLKEIDGLPNRRYSIFIYDEKTCPELALVAETKWKTYYSEGIPVYEKGFNVAFLNKTFNKMKNIIIQIYKGGSPQPNRLSIKINESKTNMNMKKNTIKLTESQLKKVIAESVKKVLKEWDEDSDSYYGGGLPDKYFDDEAPQDYSISKQQMKQLKTIADTLVEIGNEVDGGQILYKAADIIEEFLSNNG